MPDEEELRGAPAEDQPRSISEHIVELSIRLRRIVVAVAIAGIILSAIPVDTRYYIPLISYFPNKVISYVLPSEVVWKDKVIQVHIAQYNPFGGFNILLKTAMLLGILGASPIIAREIYAYIAPALYPHEKEKIVRFSFVAVGLFMIGVLVAFLIVMPFAFRIMIITSAAVAGDNTLIAFADVEQLFSTIILIAVATGVAFEAPLIVYLLVSLGIVSEEWFTGENKKFVLLASLVLGAAISPDPSGVGMLVIGLAMFSAIITAAKLGAGKGKVKRETS